MACQACDVRVLSIERKIRPLVVERAPLRRLPVPGGMALVATAGELFHVRIRVARCAGRKLHASIENGFGMVHGGMVAPSTLDLPVLSGQRVAGMIMRKEAHRLPSFRVVARGTWNGELIAVDVRVTRHTGGRQTEKSLTALPLKHPHIGCCHAAPRMAGIANDVGMLAIQRETGRRAMIKLCCIESHDLKFFAVVIAMTLGAPFACDMCVESPRGVQGCFDLLVAIETLVVRESFPVRMA